MTCVSLNVDQTLSTLAGSGIVVSRETQVSLAQSLLVKQAQSGLDELLFWGRLLTTSGKDYLIAKAVTEYCVVDETAIATSKFFFSQDAVQWLDLEDVPSEVVEQCRQMDSLLTGSPSHLYKLPAPLKPAAGVSARGPAGKSVTELQRLRAMIAEIDEAVSITPAGCRVVDAHSNLRPNRLFSGLAFPEKLESYQHTQAAPEGATLADDVRGLWSLQWDSFTGLSVVRSLLYPGYALFYDSRSVSWGGLYMGFGLRNNDLVFCL